MKIRDICPNRIFGIVRNRQGEMIFKTTGYFWDSVIDSVKSAAIALWTEGDRLACTVDDDFGEWGEWYAVFDGKEFKRR